MPTSSDSESETSESQPLSDSSEDTVIIPWPPSSPTAPSIVASSPIRGRTATERTASRREKAVKHRKKERIGNAEATEKAKMQQIKGAIAHLESEALTIIDLAEYIFNPQNASAKSLQKKHFFNRVGRCSQLLTWWISNRTYRPGSKEVKRWAEDTVVNMVSAEATKMTRDGDMRQKLISKESVTSFEFGTLFAKLQGKAAIVTTRIFTAIATSGRQVKKGVSAARTRTKQVVVVSAVASLLAEHSRHNNILKRLFGLYLYACGTQRQVISVLNHIGISESYAGLTAKVSSITSHLPKSKKKAAPLLAESSRKPQRKSPGSLIQLAESMRKAARSLAAKVTFGEVYDNINFADKVAEQIVGRTTTIESGTCATIWPLHNAKKDDMKLSSFVTAFDTAGLLAISDIDHTADETIFFRKSLVHCILRIIVNHGGDGFQQFRTNLHKSMPESAHQIGVHQTALHPLPAMKIDEATIIGNAEVDEAIVKELRLADLPSFNKYVRIIAGDQLSIARLRALASLRSGHVGGYHSFAWGVWMPGLFHAKMADMHGFFVTHWGKPNTGTRNPGSLSYHNTLLRHLPISITSLPNFRTCRDLVFVSLYARVLHCLLLVSNYNTLEEYCQHVKDWTSVEQHAMLIYDKFTDAGTVHSCRLERLKRETGGDMVYENAILFLRDGLVSREFTDAVKAGDSGRVLLVLKIWACSFRGNGRSKYAYEMLTLIHNLTTVWPKEIRDIVLNNWLLNPSGKSNSFVEVDLVQEHMNYWIKCFYKAHGTNASWEWLGIISPCVDALRHLAGTMKRVLGTDIGSRHAKPDLSRDIGVLMKNLNEHEVYTRVEGRRLDDDDQPVVDVVSEGMGNLLSGSALLDFNAAFLDMQKRRRLEPVWGDEVDIIDENGKSGLPDTIPPHAPTTPATPRLHPSTDAEILAVDDGILDVRTEMDTVEDIDGDEDNEIELGLEDEDEDTLTLLSLEDVALEMDAVEIDDYEEELDSDDDGLLDEMFAF